MNFSQIAPSIREFLRWKGMDGRCAMSVAGSAGSQRVYYRLRKKDATFILLVSPDHDKDFGRFLRITQFYRLLDFPVPGVFCIDDQARQVLLEDLGDKRLYDAVMSGSRKTPALYRSAIDMLVFLQTRCFARYLECPDIFSRVFGKRDLLWETSYFTEEYLLGHRQFALNRKRMKHLKGAFTSLAEEVAAQPRTIMHRDFQSQNIMVTPVGLRVIDYQGSRLGSIYYDAASLLLDPYIMLPDTEIQSLFRYYHTAIRSPLSFRKAFRQFLLAGAQRIMQALGAYCFLSRKKGLTQFAQYITPGEQRLAWVLKKAGLEGISSELKG